MFHERRRNNPKRDKEFLTLQKRGKHIVNSAEEMDRFLQHHIRAADRVGEGQQYFVVMDVECSNSKSENYFWHEREMRRRGLSSREIEERKRVMDGFRGRSEGRDPKMKVTEYWGNRQEERESGIIEGAVAAIQMAAVDDENGEFSFSANCLAMASDTNDGLLAFPPSFTRLLTHPSVCLLNVAVYDDIDKVVKSFTRKPIEGISYVEASNFQAHNGRA